MGTNTSKIWDILCVTSEDLDPPGFNDKRKYHPPSKPVKIDYTSFRPKQYFREDATDEEIDRHLKTVEAKEQLLKQFKHHKDFDRIDFKRMDDQIPVFETGLQNSIKLTFMLTVTLSRLIALQHSFEYFTVAGCRRLFFPCLLIMLPSFLRRVVTAPENQIINHEYYRMLPEEQSLYIELDQNLNLYKDVEDMKYNFKYSGLKDYYKTRRYVLESTRDAKKNWYKEYFQYELGTKTEQLEEYAKERKIKRKGNWDILTPEETQQIELELHGRDRPTERQ